MPKRCALVLFLLLSCASIFAADATVKFRYVAITDTHIAAPDDVVKFRNFLYTVKQKIADLQADIASRPGLSSSLAFDKA